MFELWSGVAQKQKEGNTNRLIEVTGRPIRAYDLLIAGQAMRHKVTVVTANTKEVRRVSGLASEDWAKI
jgi:tRNA(fMet)-specific endonuclease VapC